MIALNQYQFENAIRRMGWTLHKLPDGDVYAVRERYRRRDYTPTFRGERAVERVLESIQGL